MTGYLPAHFYVSMNLNFVSAQGERKKVLEKNPSDLISSFIVVLLQENTSFQLVGLHNGFPYIFTVDS